MTRIHFVTEIPLFHVLNARITFGNISGEDDAIQGVHIQNGDDSNCTCVVDEHCFDPPQGYIKLGRCLVIQNIFKFFL